MKNVLWVGGSQSWFKGLFSTVQNSFSKFLRSELQSFNFKI